MNNYVLLSGADANEPKPSGATKLLAIGGALLLTWLLWGSSAKTLRRNPLRKPEKWDSYAIDDAVKDIVDSARSEEKTAKNFSIDRVNYLSLLNDNVLGYGNVKRHKGAFPSDDRKLLRRIEKAVKEKL
jgi:hypothetical protein